MFPIVADVIAANLCLPQVADVVSRLAATLEVFPVMSEEAVLFVRSIISFLRDLIERLCNCSRKKRGKLCARCFDGLSHLLMNKVVNFGMLAIYHENEVCTVINSLCQVISGNSSIRSDFGLMTSFFGFFEKLFDVRRYLNGIDDRVYLQLIEQAKFWLSFAESWDSMAPALSAFVRDQEIVEKIRWTNEDFLIDFCMAVIRWRFVMEGRGSEVLVLDLLRTVSHWLVVQLCRIQDDDSCQEFREILSDRSLDVSEKRVGMIFVRVASAMRMLVCMYDESGDEA
jgi:hypothetical protein